MSINLSHAGFELLHTYNLTNPDFRDLIYHKDHMDKLKTWLSVLSSKTGRAYKKNFPGLFIGENAVYFTYYFGRGRINKGDQMICFYMKEAEITKQQVRDFAIEMSEEDEPLY